MGNFVTIKLPALQKSMKMGEASIDDVARYLLQNYSVFDIANALAEIFITEAAYEEIPPITISQEEFDKHFRILGQRYVDGQWVKDGRGRKTGTKVINGKVVHNPDIQGAD